LQVSICHFEMVLCCRFIVLIQWHETLQASFNRRLPSRPLPDRV
jgi:hypothetical protein